MSIYNADGLDGEIVVSVRLRSSGGPRTFNYGRNRNCWQVRLGTPSHPSTYARVDCRP